MGAPNTNNVFNPRPGNVGAVFVAPLGTALPTDEVAALDAAFEGVGFISDNGLVAGDKIDSSDITAFGGQTIATVYKSRNVTEKVTFLEHFSPVIWPLIVGDENVTITPATTTSGAKTEVKTTTAPPPKRVIVIDVIGDGSQKERRVYPNARVTDVTDVTYKSDDTVDHEVTITGYPDDTAATKYQYLNDGQVSDS